MNIDALIWIAIPFLLLVLYLVLMKGRPNVLKLSRKSNYAVAIIIIFIVIVYTIWDLFFR